MVKKYVMMVVHEDFKRFCKISSAKSDMTLIDFTKSLAEKENLGDEKKKRYKFY